MMMTMLDISTGHLSPAARDLMKIAAADQVARSSDSIAGAPRAKKCPRGSPAMALNAIGYQEGWIIYAHDVDCLRECDVPADLIAIFEYAHRVGADYIKFDCDAEPVDALPTFPWEEDA